MYKYKITNITDHQGIPKQEFFDELNEKGFIEPLTPKQIQNYFKKED